MCTVTSISFVDCSLTIENSLTESYFNSKALGQIIFKYPLSRRWPQSLRNAQSRGVSLGMSTFSCPILIQVTSNIFFSFFGGFVSRSRIRRSHTEGSVIYIYWITRHDDELVSRSYSHSYRWKGLPRYEENYVKMIIVILTNSALDLCQAIK